MRVMLGLAAAAAMLPAGAMAAFVQLECRFATGGQRDGNWVPAQLVLRHDKTGDRITVFDPIIKHFVGAPIPAALSDETRARSTYTWSVETRTGRNQSARMVYTLSYFRNGRPAQVKAAPMGYDNDFSGEGTCTVRQG